MNVRTGRRACVIAIVFASTVYGVCYGRYMIDEAAMTASAASILHNVRNALLDYRDAHGQWPDRLEYLAGHSDGLVDRFSEKPFAYFPAAEHGTVEILVAQPDAYRTRLWPFGEFKRIVVRANGKVQMLAGEEALRIQAGAQ